MRTALRTTIVLLFFALLQAAAQNAPRTFDRTYDHPADDLRQALQSLKLEESRRLPTVNGFVTDNLAIGKYERPYYEFDTEIVPQNADRTLVRVRARITAWYSDPAHSMEEYRSLTSNGRLEWEFLDRLGSYLTKVDADLDGHIASLQKMLRELAAKTDTLQKQRDDLEVRNKQMEDALQSQTQDPDYVTVLHSGTPVLDKPTAGSPTLAKSERDDVFEVVFERPGWVEVNIGKDSKGWLPESSVKKVSSQSQTALEAALQQKPEPYVVTREMVTPFMGDWSSLQGKKALFLFAQPVGMSPRDSKAKLGYVKRTFADRYREAIHSDIDYSGLVIVFIGSEKNSGIAAARLDDIGQWVNGQMPESEFLHRCSLDIPGVSH